MGVIGLVGRHLGWSDKGIKRASAVLDLVYLLGFVAMLYWAWSYMGQVHACIDLAKADCSGFFNTSIQACCPCNLTIIP